MTRNVGTTDRIIRTLIGLAILSLVFILEGSALKPPCHDKKDRAGASTGPC